MNPPIALALTAVVGAGIPTAIDAVHMGVPTICHEIAIELNEAARHGVISEEVAVEVFGNCLKSQEA